jgi:hypothetical protein
VAEDVLEDEYLLQLWRGARQVGEDDETFCTDGITGVLEHRGQAGGAERGGEDAFLGALRAGEGNGADQLEGIETRVEVGRVEQVEQEGDVVLALP